MTGFYGRDPEAIMDDFYSGCQGTADIDMEFILGEILNDVVDRYEAAMKMVELPTATIQRIKTLVVDKQINRYYPI